jgi:hypothetical protein
MLTTSNQESFISNPNLVQHLCELLLVMWKVGQTLNVGIVQPIIVDFISTCAPKLLDKFKVLIKLTHELLGKKLY